MLTFGLHFHQLEHESVHPFTVDPTLIRPSYMHAPDHQLKIKVNCVRTSNCVRTPLGKTPSVRDLICECIGLAYPDEPRIIPIDGHGYFRAISIDIIQSPVIGI